MNHLRKFQLRILAALLFVLVVWPVFQMVLCAHYRFSAWRFAGWGMYATPHPYNHQIKILFGTNSHAPGEIEFIRKAKYERQFPDVYSALNGSIAPVSLAGLSDKQAKKLKSTVRRVKMFQQPGSIRSLVIQLEDSDFGLRGADYAVVWIARPRLSLVHQYCYAEADIYVFENGSVKMTAQNSITWQVPPRLLSDSPPQDEDE